MQPRSCGGLLLLLPLLLPLLLLLLFQVTKRGLCMHGSVCVSGVRARMSGAGGVPANSKHTSSQARTHRHRGQGLLLLLPTPSAHTSTQRTRCRPQSLAAALPAQSGARSARQTHTRSARCPPGAAWCP
jgi:hypothetical protein